MPQNYANRIKQTLALTPPVSCPRKPRPEGEPCMYMYNCDFFVCFRTYLFVRALLAKILKLRRYRKPVRNLWSSFELDPSTVARVAGAQSFFFPGVDKTISRGFSKTLFYFHRAYDFFLFLRRDHDPATSADAQGMQQPSTTLQRYRAQQQATPCA